MLNDFDMIRHHIPDNGDVTVYPVSDVHLGAAEHMERAWEEFCQNVLTKERTYIILGGDLINNLQEPVERSLRANGTKNHVCSSDGSPKIFPT